MALQGQLQNCNESLPGAETLLFKIPVIPAPKCPCKTKKIIRMGDCSHEVSVLDVVFNQDAHLNAFKILKLSGGRADFNVLHRLIDQMIIRESKKTIPDPRFSPLVQGFFKSFVRLHPPCENHTIKDYLQLLEESNRFANLFREMTFQVELASQNVMPEIHPRHKGRRLYTEEFSPDCAEIVQKLQALEDTMTKKYGELPPSERLACLFAPFSIFVDILEKDFEIWRTKLSSLSANSKFYRPLIVHLLWKDVRRFDKDAISNQLCRQILKFYCDCLHITVSPTHLKAVARLLNLIGEMVDVIARHQEAKPEAGCNLNADFRNFHFQNRIETGFHSFALKEIENGRRKIQRPILYHLDESTAVGSLCKSFANSLASALRHCSCKDVKECLVLDKAFIFIKPPWLSYLTTSCLLKQEPSVALLNVAAREALSDDEDSASQKYRLRSVLFSSAMDTLQMLGYRTSGPRKDVKRASKRIKLDPAVVKSYDDVEEVITLIKSQMIKTF